MSWDAEPAKHHVLCPFCQKLQTGTEQGLIFTPGGDEAPSRTIMISCDVCDSPLVFQQEDYGQGWSELFRVWPKANRFLSSAVPSPLRNEHQEARKCFDAKAYTAAAVMVGRTLEGVCAENGFKERSLIFSLGKMKEAGKIDERLFEWANELRVLRNEGAHYTGSQVSRENAEDALALSEAMLDYMYVLTARFDEFKERRAKKEGAGQASKAPAKDAAADAASD